MKTDGNESSHYPHLFTPLKIRGTTIRNRLMQSAHARLFSHNGVESDRDIAYFRERAKGGIGLISLGSTTVHPTGGLGLGGLSHSFLPESVAALRRLVDVVHAEGTTVFSQLNHCGPNAWSSSPDGLGVLWGPSEISWGASGEQCKVMEIEDIHETIDAFALGAAVAQEAGADGVEIVIAHDYLLGSFLSPVVNRRTDEYGGTLENRLRFGREVVSAVRDRVGKDFVVGVRFSLAEELPSGYSLDDTCAMAKILIADRTTDFFMGTTGGGPSQWKSLQTGYFPNGYLIEQTAVLKAAVGDVPVFAVGGIDDPEMAENILVTGAADMVAITRGQIADPYFANKAKHGRADEIYHCIRANQGCSGRIGTGRPMGCTVNPAAGKEEYFGVETQELAEKPGRWLVIGGGAAGMKAAEGLAQRGHETTLIERQPELGGVINMLTNLPGRAPWHWIRTDLERSLHRLGVTILLGQEVTVDFVFSFAADGVIVATGSSPDRSGRSVIGEPPPGLETANVMTLWDAIQAPAHAGKKVLLLDDEGQQRIAATAELLLEAGADVLLVTRFSSLFPQSGATWEAPVIYERLLSRGLRYELNSWVKRIHEDQVDLVNLFTGKETSLNGFDSVVLGTTRHPETELYGRLKGHVRKLHRIGDCLAARTMDHAIYEGFLAGRELFSWSERPFFEQERDVREPLSLTPQ